MSGNNKRSLQGTPRPYHFPPLFSNQEQAAEYAAAQQQFDSGYEAGHTQGQQEGFAQGKEKGLAAGQQAGLEQGMAQGRQAGERLGRQQYEQVLPVLKTLSAQLQQTLDQHLQEQKEQLLQLVLQVTQRVLPAELALQPQQILRLVEESCATLPDPRHDVRIYLNVQDRQRLLALGFSIHGDWPLLEDKELKSGDCRIETSSSVVEASLQARVAECMTAVAEKLDAPHGD
jgi:flagellar assembly protein FliH